MSNQRLEEASHTPDFGANSNVDIQPGKPLRPRDAAGTRAIASLRARQRRRAPAAAPQGQGPLVRVRGWTRGQARSVVRDYTMYNIEEQRSNIDKQELRL